MNDSTYKTFVLCLLGIIVTAFFIILFSSCKVQTPKAKGKILTPYGMYDKHLFTKSERKNYKSWLVSEKRKLKKF